MKASIKIVWDTRGHEKKRALRLRVTVNRKPRLYSLGSDRLITKKEFENKRTKEAKIAFDEVEKNYQQALNIIKDLGESFSFAEFSNRYHKILFGRASDKSLFSSVVANALSRTDIEDKTRTGYITASNWIYKIFSDTIKTDDINSSSVQKLIRSMKAEGLSLNSIRIYIRALASIYSYGVRRQLINDKDGNPFKNIEGLTLTCSRRQNASLDEDELKQLYLYEPTTPQEQLGKDFFFLSLQLSGMNIGDILRLRNEAIDNKGNITFTRKKTSRTQEKTTIPLTTEASRILIKYGNINRAIPDDYILPYLVGKTNNRTIINTIGRIDKKVNAGLKTITEHLCLRRITTYTARHTFATMMQSNGMTVEQIQKFLGHASSTTTQNYIATITTSTIQKGRDILESLMSGTK